MDQASLQAMEIRALCGSFVKLSSQEFDRRLQACGADISGLQYGVLRRLSRESATISELSSNMMLAPATLVPVIDSLEHKGLLQRDLDRQDRRRKSLTITEAGVQLLAKIPVVTEDDAVVQAVAGMGAARTGQLRELLGELVTSVSGDPDLVARVLSSFRWPVTG